MLRGLNRNNRQWLIGALLVTLLVRSLIPAGFMPATDRPFSFQICPDGFPAHLLTPAADPHAAHHHHDDGGDTHKHSSASSEHCVFAAATGAAPLAFALTLSSLAIVFDAPESFYAAPAIEARRFLNPQPRGPPALS